MAAAPASLLFFVIRGRRELGWRMRRGWGWAQRCKHWRERAQFPHPCPLLNSLMKFRSERAAAQTRLCNGCRVRLALLSVRPPVCGSLFFRLFFCLTPNFRFVFWFCFFCSYKIISLRCFFVSLHDKPTRKRRRHLTTDTGRTC